MYMFLKILFAIALAPFLFCLITYVIGFALYLPVMVINLLWDGVDWLKEKKCRRVNDNRRRRKQL